MRGNLVLVVWSAVAACSFTPQQATNNDATGSSAMQADAGSAGSGSGSDMGSGSGSGSDMGSGSGSGSGSNAWPCGTQPADPGANRGELATGHGGWQTTNMMVDGVNSRLAVIQPGGSVSLAFNYFVAVTCGLGKTCPLQLQIGTDQAKTGCVFDGSAVGMGFPISIATHMQNGYTTSIQLATAGTYQIMVDPAASASGCGTAWTNGQPDSNEVIAIVCVAP